MSPMSRVRYEPGVGWSLVYTTRTPQCNRSEVVSYRDLTATHSSLREKRVYDIDFPFRE